MKRLLTIMVCLLAMMVASLSAKAQDVTITLFPGWNWIGYPYLESADLETALSGFEFMDGDRIKSHFGFSEYDSEWGWYGEIDELKPGWGYMYYSNRTEAVALVFSPPTAPMEPISVTTSEPMLITAVSAMGGGEVTTSDGTYIIVKGLCWAAHENPTTNDDFYQEAESGVGSFSISMTELNMSTTYYVRAYAVTANGTVYGDQKTFTTLEGYVDLGLPSGTLWATCNIGTDIPEGYGSYFAWGETTTKSTYTWSTYQYCIGSDNTLTKYCSNSSYGYNGFTDNLTTLELSDDAATANWGNDWRMPTEEEWQELYTNTTCTWTTQNGVNGRLFTATNGNSLFLPAAGYHGNSSLCYAGSKGFYWSSSLCADNPNNAWELGFHSDNYGMYHDGRYFGQSVRAVRSGFKISVTVNPSEGGEVSGGGTYRQGEECTLTATANECFTFTSWIENGLVISFDTIYTFTVNSDRTLVANFTIDSIVHDHEYVDLGLPSGLLWATCNVGADTPEDYGSYFAWGEAWIKGVYNWSTYQYSNSNDTLLTKYCNNSNYGYNGFIDNLTVLLPEDDAATANWGNDWRMPTKEEWQELYNNTTCTWITQNGVNGRLFTASNGNSLFLPAAGYRSGSSLSSIGSRGYYWSSSLDTDRPDFVWEFRIFENGMYNTARYFGQSVRAVRSSAQSNVPTGAIDGKFTINDNGDQVYFSQGNLQYIGSAATPYWKFADNQWDILGTTTGQNSSDQNVDRDLFGWGTSGWNNGNTYYRPWDTNNSGGNSYGPDGLYDLTGTYANADWGVYNQISNGGNQANQWRTLTHPEWAYIFNTRITSSGIRYAKAKVNDVNGVILLPDNWSTSFYTLSNTNSIDANFGSNIISASQWDILEQHGAVFLPAAGHRDGASVCGVGIGGYYRSASYVNKYSAYSVYFDDSSLGPLDYFYRSYGFSVRLARIAE